MAIQTSKLNKHRFPIKKIIIVIIALIPIVLLSSILLPLNNYMVTLNNYFINEVSISTDEFMEVDTEYLESAAYNWSRFSAEYTLPENLTGDGWDFYPWTNTKFKQSPGSYGIYNESKYIETFDPFDQSLPINEVDYYSDPGHSATFCGQGLFGEAMKYAVLARSENETALQNQTDLILKLVKAFDLLSAVTPDGSMARYVVPDTPKGRELFDHPVNGFFEYEYADNHLMYATNYTAENGKTYTFWAESGTSVDLYLGVLMGLGITYAFVNNNTIRSIVRTTVDRMLEFLEYRGWRFIDNDGKAHICGAESLNQQPFTDSTYCLMFLRVGKTVHPERWSELYNTYVYERLLYRQEGKQTDLGFHDMFVWGNNYFNVELMVSLAVTLCVLETDAKIKNHYQDQFMERVYYMVRNHRNAWFDTAYALAMSDVIVDIENYEQSIKIPTNEKIDSTTWDYLEKDTGDGLMRCAITKKTGRVFIHANGMESYNESIYISPIENAPYPDLEKFDWKSQIDYDNPFVKILADARNPTMGWSFNDGCWDGPMPADWRITKEFIWDSSPFRTSTLNQGGQMMSPSGDMTLPYWIGRFVNFSNL